ncbi:MAG: PilZ domain-containing protein [Alphaproteobacteria bacterium]|nr:PilZ domain-containing protein [Alphaproteobacteria bacterium]
MAEDSDRRRHPRHDIPIEGTLHSRGEESPCRVRNLSPGGALIEVETSLRPGHFVAVELPEMGKLSGRVVRVIWRLAAISLEEGEEKVEAYIVEWLDGQPEDKEGG